MILLDPRQGSGELRKLFGSYDVPVEVVQLDSGDAMFFGNGPDDKTVAVAVERKRLHDLIDSIRSSRLSGSQLGKLCSEYDYVYIIVEGIWKAGAFGELVFYAGSGWRVLFQGNRSVLYREVMGYLYGLELRVGTEAGGPVRVHRTSDPTETVADIVSLYRNFNDKTWEQHVSHEAIYGSYSPWNSPNGHRGRFTRRTVGVVEKIAAQLPGVDRIAFDIGSHFRTAEALIDADIVEWSRIPITVHGKGGKKTQALGKKRASRIWRALHEGGNP